MANLDDLAKVKANLEKRVQLQNIMKSSNKIINDKKLSNDQKLERLMTELNLTAEQAAEIIKPDYMGRIGFPAYKLQTNNAEINRLKGRMLELEKRHFASKEGNKTYEFDGGTFEIDYDDDRVKIFFDDIPAADLREKMKRSGWNWSPRNKAWQRKITDAAIYSAKQLTGATETTKSEEPKGKPEFIDYKGIQIMFEPNKNEYFVLTDEFERNNQFGLRSLTSAKEWIDEIIERDNRLSNWVDEEKEEQQPVNKYSHKVGDLVHGIEDNKLYKVSSVMSDGRIQVQVPNQTWISFIDEPTNYIPFEEKEETVKKAIYKIDGKEYDLTDLELPEDHPIMILDRDSSQWKQAVKEHFAKPVLKGSPTIEEIKKYFIHNEMLKQMTTDKAFYTMALISDYNKDYLTDKEQEAIEYFIDQEFIEELNTDERYFVEALVNHAENKRSAASFPNEMKKPTDEMEIPKMTDPEDTAKMEDYLEKSAAAATGDSEITAYMTLSEFDKIPLKTQYEYLYWIGWDVWTYEEIEKRGNGSFTAGVKDIMEKDGVFVDFQKILDSTDKNTYRLIADVEKSNELSAPATYKNQFELNRAIEKWLDERNITAENANQRQYSEDEKNFVRSYTGYGGLGKYDKKATADVLRTMEFYTPNKVIEIMWGLAYKNGFKADQSVLETSAGTGEFLQYAKQSSRIMAFEISRYSSAICKILYPYAEVINLPFEKRFIERNYSIKDNIENLPKFDLCIGNPPYASFDRLDKKAARYLLGMGEKDFTKANNYVEYFLRRSLDMLKPNGLLIQIVGAELMNGGNLFLDSANSAVKTYLSQNAELIEAYRLPAGIFETTNVTSEILVIRKKA